MKNIILAGLLLLVCPFLKGNTDAGIAGFDSISTKYCDQSIEPVVLIENLGNTTINTCLISYSYDQGDGPEGNVSWTGQVDPGGSWEITVPISTISLGAHVIMVEILQVNGIADNDPSNNGGNFNFYVFQEDELTVSFSDSICMNGNALLQASTNGFGVIEWFQNEHDIFRIGKGFDFVTSELQGPTTYFVDLTKKTTVGAFDHTIGSANYGGMGESFLSFNTFQDVVIKSVKINANASGTSSIVLSNSTNQTLDSIGFNYATGYQVIDINFPVGIGTDYRLAVTESSNLLKNSSGSIYPYNALEVLEITGSELGSAATNYPFLYDWKIDFGQPCGRTAVPVYVSEDNFEAAFEPGDTIIPVPGSTLISYTDLSDGATEWSWIFGDGEMSDQQNPIHAFLGLGNHEVILKAKGPTSCKDVATSLVSVQFITSTSETNARENALFYPNPFQDNLNIDLDIMPIPDIKIFSTDFLGRRSEIKIIRLLKGGEINIDTRNWVNGIYVIEIRLNDIILTRKVIKN